MAFYFTGTMVVLSAGSSHLSSQSTNAQAEASQANTRRRYELKSKIAENQMEEQKSLAMEKMTEVTRSFLKTKGTMEVVQAETMVAGNVAKRLKGAARTEASEAKGQIAKVTNRNIQNIAQDMIAEKVDSEALLMEAESRKKSSLTMLLDAGMAGASTYVGMGGPLPTKTTSGVKD